MAKVELKQPIVEEIKAKIDGAATVVLVDYRGLTVEQDTKLRKGLREAGCEYKVYKNTLMKRAFEGTDFALTPFRMRNTSIGVTVSERISRLIGTTL